MSLLFKKQRNERMKRTKQTIFFVLMGLIVLLLSGGLFEKDAPGLAGVLVLLPEGTPS